MSVHFGPGRAPPPTMTQFGEEPVHEPCFGAQPRADGVEGRAGGGVARLVLNGHLQGVVGFIGEDLGQGSGIEVQRPGVVRQY